MKDKGAQEGLRTMKRDRTGTEQQGDRGRRDDLLYRIKLEG